VLAANQVLALALVPVASMGWMLAGGFAAGLSLRAADLLGTPVPGRARRGGPAGVGRPARPPAVLLGRHRRGRPGRGLGRLRLALRARRLGRQQAEVAELYGVAVDPRGPR
jgi:hypothetical protein